jgi:hypothetical protein
MTAQKALKSTEGKRVMLKRQENAWADYPLNFRPNHDLVVLYELSYQ